MSNEGKRIVVAAEIYPPDIGGPATYAQMLVESLKSKVHKVQLVRFGETERGVNMVNVGDEVNKVVIVNRRRTLCIRLFFYLFTLLKLSRDTDVVYAMGPGVSGLCAVIAGRLLRKRVVVKVTGDRAWEAAQLQGSDEDIVAFQTKRHKGWIGALEWIERWVVRYADAIITPGDFLRGIVRGWGARDEKIKNIPNAVHPSYGFPLMRGEGLHQYPLPAKEEDGGEGVYKILAIGRLVPWKGIADAIAALPLVRARVPDARLIIVGDGPEEEYLKAFSQKCEVSDAVRFTGRLTPEELSEYWVSAKTFTLVSGYEGFPHLVLEAWHAGVPVVASDIPANRDIIKNEVNGLLVSYKDPKAIADAIVRVFTDTAMAQRLIANGQRERGKYSWEKVFEETEKVLFPI